MLLWLLACTPDPATFPVTDEEPGDSVVQESDPQDSPVDTGDLWVGVPRVMLFVGDGMGFEHVAGGAALNGAALRMEELPHQGRLQTASLTGTTDSAAGGTALYTGQKTFNARLAVDRYGADAISLAELAWERGMSVGVVTSDTLTGATPAAFLIHAPDRYDASEIGARMMQRLPEVLLGGGRGVLDPLLDQAGVASVATWEELQTTANEPLVGLFAEKELTYQVEIDEEEGATEPSLAQMTQAALARLEADPEGFLLLVEGARIDHASHARMAHAVHYETAAFDEAVGAGIDWAQASGEEVAVVVTADHECGGLHLTGESTEEAWPATSFLWGAHTNDDVPVYAMGPRTHVFDQARLQNVWVHAALSAAITGVAVQAPEVGRIADGWSEEQGEVLVRQTHPTSMARSQLDALRVAADADGLWIGVDGVFNDRSNLPLVLLDLDFGDSTGFGVDSEPLGDFEGALDEALSNLALDLRVAGLGFDLAIGSIDARPVSRDRLESLGGVRGVAAPWMNPNDLWWLHGVLAFDDGNVARWDQPARDTAETGLTEGGWEILLPWHTPFPEGMPQEGLEIALVALLTSWDGKETSNQALPPFASSSAPGTAAVPIERVVRLHVDPSGSVASGPELLP